MVKVRGELPGWAVRDGSGAGDGYGYGDGYGDGSGSGDGSGAGDGYGYGDGSGYGDGYGSGYGYGEDVHRCRPLAVEVTSQHLAAAQACPKGVWAFKRVFPDGARWPADLEKAAAAGLDIDWAVRALGLPMPVTED